MVAVFWLGFVQAAMKGSTETKNKIFFMGLEIWDTAAGGLVSISKIAKQDARRNRHRIRGPFTIDDLTFKCRKIRWCMNPCCGKLFRYRNRSLYGGSLMLLRHFDEHMYIMATIHSYFLFTATWRMFGIEKLKGSTLITAEMGRGKNPGTHGQINQQEAKYEEALHCFYVNKYRTD